MLSIIIARMRRLPSIAKPPPPRRPISGGNGGSCGRRGFSLLELVIVLGIIALVMAILLPVMHRARDASQGVTCLSNLRQITIAFHLFADRNGKLLPDVEITNVSWEASLLPYTRASLFKCPADGELYPSIGSSYDWRDTAKPETTLAGKEITSPLRSALVLVFEALPGWHAKGRINAAYIDGSAHEMEYEACLLDLEKANNLP